MVVYKFTFKILRKKIRNCHKRRVPTNIYSIALLKKNTFGGNRRFFLHEFQYRILDGGRCSNQSDR